MSLALSRNWDIHQLDVNNAFLHGDLEKTIYFHQLSTEFAMKDLGPLSYFSSIVVTRTRDTMVLNQQKYAKEIIAQAYLSSCKPTSTLIDTKSKLSVRNDKPIVDPTLYRQLARALQYLTITRPNISYAVQ